MTEQTPETFDFDAWLSGASRPMRSAQIFQRGDMLADLDELARRIELAEAAPAEERSLADSPNRLRARYADLAQQFASSAIDVRVQGHDVDETRAIQGDRYAQADVPAINRDLVFDAIVWPAMSREQFDLFVRKIGPHQFQKLTDAYNSACRDTPKPSADFLPRPSTPDDGE